jgi:NagD protein
MRTALNAIDAHSEESVMVGDNMATDIVAGVESGLETILVLSGVTDRDVITQHAFQPTRIVGSVAEIEP